MEPGVARFEGRGAADILFGARAVVFDFDGTLVDSNAIKWRGFEVCFAGLGERVTEILAYCRGNHHTPRDEKFRHVYERILGLPYTRAVAIELHERFAAATTSQIVTAPEIPGAERFLRALVRRCPTGLLSSTPQEILKQIVQARGWAEYFVEIQGAPVDKAAWLQGYRTRRGLGDGEVLLFGDTPEDAAAAQAAGCPFVAVGSMVGRHAVPAVEHFLELALVLEEEKNGGSS